MGRGLKISLYMFIFIHYQASMIFQNELKDIFDFENEATATKHPNHSTTRKPAVLHCWLSKMVFHKESKDYLRSKVTTGGKHQNYLA